MRKLLSDKERMVFQNIPIDTGIKSMLFQYYYPEGFRIWEHPISNAIRVDEDTVNNRDIRERFGFVDCGTVGEFAARVKARREAKNE